MAINHLQAFIWAIGPDADREHIKGMIAELRAAHTNAQKAELELSAVRRRLEYACPRSIARN
jgi:hypothetical protein